MKKYHHTLSKSLQQKTAPPPNAIENRELTQAGGSSPINDYKKITGESFAHFGIDSQSIKSRKCQRCL